MSDGGSGPSSFTCHRCGACCTDLRERGTEQAFAEIAPGVYRLPSEGGLRVFAWEADRFPEDRLAPVLAVADSEENQLVVLAYELEADTCPRFDVEEAACTIYEHRPLVCRAFPLVVEPGSRGLSVAASAVCGARIPLEELADGDREAALAHAYPKAAAPALAIPAIVRWSLQLVGFLEAAGELAPAEGLEESRLEGFPAVSLRQRLDAGGLLDGGELGERAHRIVEEVDARIQPSSLETA